MLGTVAKILGALAFTGVVAVGLLYVRLLNGPLALNFLIPTFESGIAEEFSGTGVRIDTAVLRLNDSGLLQFELGNVRVTDAGGEPLVMAPSAAVSLSRRAILRGRLAVESLDLVSARLTVFYSDEGALSLQFSHAPHPAASATPPLRGSADTPSPAAAPPDADWTLGRIDLVKVLAEASARARRREHAGAYLREIGLRGATVIIDNGTRKSIWRVPEFDLDLDHRRSRSSIAGRAKIESLAGPWELNFRTYEHVNAKALNLAVSVQGLVPRGLARTFPQLVGLEGLDVPLWVDAKLEVATSGEIMGGKIVVDAAPGNVALPWLAAAPMRIDGAHVELSYAGATRRFEVAPSVLTWGDSRLQFTGNIVHVSQGADGPGWQFDIKSVDGWLAAEPPELQKLPIDQLLVRGFLAPEHDRIVLSQFLLKAGAAEVSAQGDVSDVGGALKGQLDGRIGPMRAATFKTLWPNWVAPGTRGWVSRRLLRGSLTAGHFKVVHGAGPPAPAGWAPVGNVDRVSLALEGANLEFAVADGKPPLEIPRGLLRIDGRSVEFTVPEAAVAAADGRKLALKGTFTVDLDEPLPRTGRLAVKGQGPLAAVLEMLDQDTLASLKDSGLTLAGIDGKVEAALNAKVPLTAQMQPHDAVVEGTVRVSDGKVRNVLGAYDAQGLNLAIDLSPTAAEGKAEFLLKGVPARASWQHVFGTPADKQPPLRVTASLDNNERTQLGLDINDIVQGDVGVEIIVSQDAQGERDVHVRADLTNAELTLESLAWHKPKGRPSLFEFDLAKGTTYPNELRNVKLVGENVAMAGWMGAGSDFRIREFRFPQFSVNVVTILEAHGKLRADNVWDVVAKGPTYEGKELFQAFFDINAVQDRNAKVRPGLDLRAEIDTVVGFYDISLRGVRVTLQKRAGKLTQLDARGVLSGNKQFEASLRQEQGRPRLLNARSADAGQVFKLVGFYPHAIGGDMNLDVNLDGQGVAERTGLLTATRFHVLGDAISVQNAPGSETAAAARRNVVRERFEFNTLRAPFSVGHGQFVLHNAAIEGPLISATMLGKLDFRTRVMQVGGTFTPLSTLNKLFSEVPLFGDIVTGPKREGVFAMTYALQGGLENPELIVNPFSAITPGITRELMQITPSDPRIVPRKPPSGRSETGKAARSSNSPAIGPQSKDSSLDGWSSESNQSEAKKR